MSNNQKTTAKHYDSSSFNSKLIKNSLRLLFILTISVCLLIGFLLTPWGAKAVVNTANNLVGELTVEYQSGGIGSELYLSSITWQQQGTQVDINDLRLSLRLSCVWRLAFCIDSIAATKTFVQLKPTGTSASKESTNPVFTLPFPISIQKLSFSDFALQIQDTLDIRWQQLTGKLDFHQNLRLDDMQIDGFKLTTFAADESNVSAYVETFDWAKWQYKPIAPLPIILPIHFEMIAINLTPASIHLAGQPALYIQNVSLKAKGDKETLQLDELVIEHDQGQLLAKGNVQLNGNFEHVFSIDAKAQLANQPPLKLVLRSSGNFDSVSTQVELTESNLSASSHAEPLKLTMDFTAQPSQATLPVNMQLNWQHLAWPLAVPEFHSDNGVVQVSGDLNALKMTVQTLFAGKNVPDTQVNLNVIASSTAQYKVFELSEFILETLDGQVLSQGRLTFSEYIDWQGSSIVKHIDPSAFWPQWVADINGDFATQANNSQGVWQAKLENLDINGQWQGYPLSVTGEVDIHQNDGLQIQNLSLKNADNSVLLNGVLSKQQAVNIG